MAICMMAALALGGCGSGGGGSDSPVLGGTTGGGTTDGGTDGGTADNTGGGTVTGVGTLGALTDIGDLLGAGGDAWYDTETIDINILGQIIGSSMSVPIFWDPASPDSMTIIPGHPSAYDDYFGLKTTPSNNTFEVTNPLQITDSGLVIGNSFTKTGESESRAYIWDSTSDTFIDLTPPNYTDNDNKRIIKEYSNVVDINTHGEVLLTADNEDGRWAYYWDGVTFETISDLQDESGATLPAFDVPRLLRVPSILGATSSTAVALNDNGQGVVNSGDTAAFFDLNNGGRASLNSLGGASTQAVDINNSGHVIGNSGNEGFFWRGGVMYPISNPTGDTVVVVDINNNDQVVGNSGGKAFIWHLDLNKNGVFQEIGTLGGSTSTVAAINDQGLVIGTSETSNTYSEGNISRVVEHGFLWRNGAIYDLGAHSPPNYSYPFHPDLFFSRGTAINENGVVAGDSFSINAHARGFTLTPVFP
ncbi:hypothetical protein DESUT3_40260 [Desulfuromonas versatilis]|uniref:DUF3466 family protein n=1 Tax=Desulfuromonas versatilis TaxID=2802975 RepID=A0ABM8I298_9BACT|nr:hypothetical protein DESUT3_40260 [Desulfuromonas versatilis]